MAGLPAPVEAVRPRRASHYYVFRLRQDRHDGEPLIDIVDRKFYNSGADPGGAGTFIAGDMDATMA